MKHVLWIPHVTICLIWILPAFHLNYETTQLLAVLNLNLSLILKTYFNWILPVSHLKIHPALRQNFFLNMKDNWTMPTFHQQMFSLNTMTMNCSYYKRRLKHHMTISTIRTLMSVKIKMTSSFIPPTLATFLDYPNSYAQHNCEDLKPTGNPSSVPTTLQASSDHTFNPKCAHNLMASLCD